jgi:translation elongation factor EF-Tu-like GTPase
MTAPSTAKASLNVGCKPHVNIGTIGHVDHGKTTTLTVKDHQSISGDFKA